MGENIIIQEGGVGKQLTADKFKVNKVGGGTVLYVLESSTALGTKSITENGTYNAEDDGYAGYSQVHVNVSGGGGGGGDSVVGRDSDGDEAVVTKDPDTGDLVVTKIPSSIRVTRPPTNPYGTYIDGQTITKDGMVVKGYLATGSEWGTVPTADVTINPTTAVYDQSTDDMEHTIDDSALEHPEYISQPLGSINEAQFGVAPQDSFIVNVSNISCDYMLIFKYSTGNYNVIGFSEQQSAGQMKEITYERYTDPITQQYNYRQYSETVKTTSQQTTTRVSGKAVYYLEFSEVAWRECDSVVNELSGLSMDIRDIATILYDGEHTGRGSHQQIAVTWPRPGDGAVLETSFEILVGPRAGQGDD